MNKQQILKSIRLSRRKMSLDRRQLLGPSIVEKTSTVYSKPFAETIGNKIEESKLLSSKRITKFNRKELINYDKQLKLASGRSFEKTIIRNGKQINQVIDYKRQSEVMRKKQQLTKIVDEVAADNPIDKELYDRYLRGELTDPAEIEMITDQLAQGRAIKKMKRDLNTNPLLTNEGQRELLDTVERRFNIDYLEVNIDNRTGRRLEGIGALQNNKLRPQLERIASRGRITVNENENLEDALRSYQTVNRAQQPESLKAIESTIKGTKKYIKSGLRTGVTLTQAKKSLSFLNKLIKLIGRQRF